MIQGKLNPLKTGQKLPKMKFNLLKKLSTLPILKVTFLWFEIENTLNSQNLIFSDIRFQPPGHSTVISSAMKSTRPLFISTRGKYYCICYIYLNMRHFHKTFFTEKIHHDRLERNKKGIILQKIREKSITARRTFELSPSNWRTPYASGIGKTPTLLRRRPM